jgi:hypothetical protein
MAKQPKSTKQSGDKMTHAASEIMRLAKHGGPLLHFKKELEEQFPETPINTDFLDRMDRIMRTYIDVAESLAASVLSQAKPKGQSK